MTRLAIVAIVRFIRLVLRAVTDVIDPNMATRRATRRSEGSDDPPSGGKPA